MPEYGCPRSICRGDLVLDEDGWHRCDVCGFATGDPVELPGWIQVQADRRQRW